MRNGSIYFLALVVIVLSGCGSVGKFAGTFGKRHYTKGYYWERAGSGEKVALNTQRKRSPDSYRERAGFASVNGETKPTGITETSLPDNTVIRQESKTERNTAVKEHRLSLKAINAPQTNPKTLAVATSECGSISELGYNGNTSQATDWAVVSFIFTLIGLIFLTFIIVYSASITGAIGWFFGLGMAVAFILGFLFAVLGTMSPNEQHIGLLHGIEWFYDIIFLFSSALAVIKI